MRSIIALSISVGSFIIVALLYARGNALAFDSAAILLPVLGLTDTWYGKKWSRFRRTLPQVYVAHRSGEYKMDWVQWFIANEAMLVLVWLVISIFRAVTYG